MGHPMKPTHPTKSHTTKLSTARILLLLTGSFVLLAVAVAISPSFSPKPIALHLSTSAAQSPDAATAARIARIENGLLPAVVIKGQPPAPMTIADRMAHHKVPGVSVAFFDHGQIVWARGYGFADVT